MNTLPRKGYARIYVLTESDIPYVKEIIKDLEPFEYDYLPEKLIAPFGEYPRTVYTHKFDGMCMNKLCAACWQKGIHIWVMNDGHDDSNRLPFDL